MALISPLRVIATLEGDDVARMRIQAEVVAVPRRLSSAEFADRLIAESGLAAPTSVANVIGPLPDTPLQVKSLFATNGLSIIVYYRNDGPFRGRVCRLREDRSGGGGAHDRAIRWCAAALGVILHEFQPPVFTVPG